MKSILIISLIYLFGFSVLATEVATLKNKDAVRKKILENVCATLPNHPVCLKTASEFLPLSPRLTPDEVLQSFTGAAQIENNIYKLAKITEGKVDVQPWSGHYWPIYQGGIAARPNDPNFPSSNDYLDYKNYLDKEILRFNPQTANTKILSAAEKYDLINHDLTFSLTQTVKNEGLLYLNGENKTVETWMGICHGWAPAAYVLPRPIQTVKVKSPILGEKVEIEFQPDDIKALGSQLWAKGKFPTTFIGSRCNEKDPKMDRSGHIKDIDCFDTDPATFHRIMVEMIAKQKKSFVFDVTYNYEVWNQPIVAFEVSFSNPQNNKTHQDFKDNLVELKKIKKDPYKKFRSPDAKYLVTVDMNIVYVGETSPVDNSVDEPSYDNLIDVNYSYDLEIAENGEILGGEWHQAEHPDFLWTPYENVKVMSPFDQWIRFEWNPEVAVPPLFTQFSQGAGKLGFPLGKVVYPLFDAASY